MPRAAGMADRGRLALSATDMDLEIVERVPAQIERPGRTTAPAHTLYDIVRKLREGAQIEIEASGERSAMVLRSGRSTFTLACLPPEDYPVMASGELPHHFTLTAAELRSLIDRTRFAISTEETRYYLNGIYLHATKNDEVPVIRAVATDGHRLARVEMVLPEGAAGMPGVIVPRKTVIELRKLVEESEDEIQVVAERDQDPLCHRRGGADLEADRRHLPRLRPGDPDQQRQDPRGQVQGVRRGGRPGLDDLDREEPGGQARDRDPGGAMAAASPCRRRARKTAPRSRRSRCAISPSRSRSASTRATSSTSPRRSSGEGAQFVMSDSASPTIVRDSADPSALYVLMPMRV